MFIFNNTLIKVVCVTMQPYNINLIYYLLDKYLNRLCIFQRNTGDVRSFSFSKCKRN